jgi:hypothetical protein
VRVDVTEVLPAAPTATPAPMKLSKLALAMQVVQTNIATIESFDTQVAALVAANPAGKQYDLTTKEGRKACDEARAEARKKRLAIDNMVKDGKSLLNGLKDELVAAGARHTPLLAEIETNAKTQLEAAAKAEEDRIQRHRDAIAAIGLMSEGCSTWSSVDCAAKLQAMESVIVDESYEEFEEEARKKRADVVEVLTQATAAAIQREHEERQRAEADAKRAQAQAAIDAMKLTPSQVEGTDIENVRHVLRIHEKTVPTATEFGDLLETAELWHFKVTKQLEDMVAELEAQAEPDDDVDGLAMYADEPAAEPKGADGLPAGADRLFADEPYREPQSPAAAEDPFADDKLTKPADLPPVTATTHTVPAGSVGAPGRRMLMPRPVAPAVVTAGIGDSQIAPVHEAVASIVASSDTPDLLQTSREVLKQYDALKVMDSPLSMVMLGPFGDAIEKLRGAVDFISEFAD